MSDKLKPKPNNLKYLSRRDFLKLIGAGAGGVFLSACKRSVQQFVNTLTPYPPTLTATLTQEPPKTPTPTENPYANVNLFNLSTIPNTEYFQTGVWPTADTQIAQAPYFDAANTKFLIEHGISETEIAKMTEYERFLQSAIIANEQNIIPPVSLDLIYRMLQDTPQLAESSENGLGIAAGRKWNLERALFEENYTLPAFYRNLLVTHVPVDSIVAEGAIVVKYADKISGLIAYYHTDDGQLRFVPLAMIDKQIIVNQVMVQNVPGTPSSTDTVPEGKYYIKNLTLTVFEDGLAYDGQELVFVNQERQTGRTIAIEADQFGIDPRTGLQILKRIYGSLNP